MRARGWAAPAVLAVLLGGAALALQWSGGGSLAPPPLGDPGRWAGWLAGRDPVVAAFSLLRLTALAALWYLVATTVVGVALRLAGAARLAAAADRLTVGPVRRLLAGVSLSLAATTMATVTGPVAMAVAAQPAPQASTTTPAAGPAATAAGPAATVTMHLLGPAELAPTLQPAPQPASTVAPPPAGPASAPSPDRWTVQPGQCFWTIAEAVLARAWGRAPTDAEIVPYWQRLISVNRAALAAPSNPDLIFPGQVFEVPGP